MKAEKDRIYVVPSPDPEADRIYEDVVNTKIPEQRKIVSSDSSGEIKDWDEFLKISENIFGVAITGQGKTIGLPMVPNIGWFYNTSQAWMSAISDNLRTVQHNKISFSVEDTTRYHLSLCYYRLLQVNGTLPREFRSTLNRVLIPTYIYAMLVFTGEVRIPEIGTLIIPTPLYPDKIKLNDVVLTNYFMNPSELQEHSDKLVWLVKSGIEFMNGLPRSSSGTLDFLLVSAQESRFRHFSPRGAVFQYWAMAWEGLKQFGDAEIVQTKAITEPKGQEHLHEYIVKWLNVEATFSFWHKETWYTKVAPKDYDWSRLYPWSPTSLSKLNVLRINHISLPYVGSERHNVASLVRTVTMRFTHATVGLARDNRL